MQKLGVASSDDAVVEGATYLLVVKSPGEPDERLTLSSETFALFLRAWKQLESEAGTRLDSARAFERMVAKAHANLCNGMQRSV